MSSCPHAASRTRTKRTNCVIVWRVNIAKHSSSLVVCTRRVRAWVIMVLIKVGSIVVAIEPGDVWYLAGSPPLIGRKCEHLAVFLSQRKNCRYKSLADSTSDWSRDEWGCLIPHPPLISRKCEHMCPCLREIIMAITPSLTALQAVRWQH